ncbi:MAG: chromate transporter [Firmicutes bacterium]|nr:chromate transporter [Bacillota bacterium]
MIELILLFIYVGLFTIGGGMVAIPLIQQEVVARGWLTLNEFISMVAIAQSTPGPIGINVATYVGFEHFGILGAIAATFGFVLPSFLIVSSLANLLRKHRSSSLVINWFYFIKAGIIGLIGYAFVKVVLITVISVDPVFSIDWIALLLLLVLTVIFKLLKKLPWLVIVIGAILGMLFL